LANKKVTRHQKRHFNNKEAIVAIAKELAEIRDRIYIMEMAFDMYIDFRKTNKSNGKKAFTKFMTDKMKENENATQANDKPDGKDSQAGQANP
tara:strand:- start:2281 stop:2559 length:279 start_codon:yes stop_codon:yes gene_type:complete